MSFYVVDHVPSNIPERPCPARRYISEDTKQSFVTHVSRTYRVDPDWLFERINWNSYMSIRFVRTTEQVANFLTKGAFTTIQWKALMRLCDIHSQPKLNVR